MSINTDWTPSLWMETFDKLVDDDNELDYGDEWNLNFNYSQTNTVTKEEKKRGWKVYSPCTFGNFQCGNCDNTWSSARVVILFRYRLRHDRGTVIMRPLGQSCRQCHDERFDRPGFSEDTVETTLLNLCSKIRKNCYNDEDEDDSYTCTNEVKTKPHKKELCEGCQMGICCED